MASINNPLSYRIVTDQFAGHDIAEQSCSVNGG